MPQLPQEVDQDRRGGDPVGVVVAVYADPAAGDDRFSQIVGRFLGFGQVKGMGHIAQGRIPEPLCGLSFGYPPVDKGLGHDRMDMELIGETAGQVRVLGPQLPEGRHAQNGSPGQG